MWLTIQKLNEFLLLPMPIHKNGLNFNLTLTANLVKGFRFTCKKDMPYHTKCCLHTHIHTHAHTPHPLTTEPYCFTKRLVSDHVYEVTMAIATWSPFLSIRNRITSVRLRRRWSSYVIWFVLHIRVEAWVAQVISYGGIDEGNSNTSCSVWIVERNGRMGMVSLTNNFKFCRLNWK